MRPAARLTLAAVLVLGTLPLAKGVQYLATGTLPRLAQDLTATGLLTCGIAFAAMVHLALTGLWGLEKAPTSVRCKD